MSDRIDELVDTPEQALRFLDTVMHSDNEDMRRGAFNRVSIHIQQLAAIAREAETRGFGHAQVVQLRDSVRQMLEYIGRHEQFCDAAALVAYGVDEMLRAVIPSTDLQRAFRAIDERARKAEARCEWLAEQCSEQHRQLTIGGNPHIWRTAVSFRQEAWERCGGNTPPPAAAREAVKQDER